MSVKSGTHHCTTPSGQRVGGEGGNCGEHQGFPRKPSIGRHYSIFATLALTNGQCLRPTSPECQKMTCLAPASFAHPAWKVVGTLRVPSPPNAASATPTPFPTHHFALTAPAPILDSGPVASRQIGPEIHPRWQLGRDELSQSMGPSRHSMNYPQCPMRVSLPQPLSSASNSRIRGIRNEASKSAALCVNAQG
jgi:hypothetical protein